MPTIEVPVQKIVKDYFLHPANLGADGYVSAKSELGRLIICLLAFEPIDEAEFLTKGKPASIYETPDFIELNISFLKTDLIRPVHLIRLGNALSALFEREFFLFVAGRFSKAPNFLAATKNFLELFTLIDSEKDLDNFRRVMERRYRDKIQAMVDLHTKKNMKEYQLQLMSAGYTIK